MVTKENLKISSFVFRILYLCLPNESTEVIIHGLFGVWLRPVERTVRVREVPSSNLGTPTLGGVGCRMYRK